MEKSTETEINDDTAELHRNSREWLRPHQFKKGQSGNPTGRPKGSISLKEYAKKYLQELNDEDKLEFLEGLDKKTMWEMGEGKPNQDGEVQLKVMNVVVPPEVAKAFNINATNPETSGGDTEQGTV